MSMNSRIKNSILNKNVNLGRNIDLLYTKLGVFEVVDLKKALKRWKKMHSWGFGIIAIYSIYMQNKYTPTVRSVYQEICTQIRDGQLPWFAYGRFSEEALTIFNLVGYDRQNRTAVNEYKQKPAGAVQMFGLILQSAHLYTASCLWEFRHIGQGFTVCPGSSDPTLNIESNYFIQLSSSDLKLFCSVNE